ncbi:hypothetical protein [Escherichia coli]|uniref:hypothetical protein n=1 Tax=Escherichia coli TaxID=562 RepID=UPI003D9C7DD1
MLHQQACRDGFQGIVDCLGDSPLNSIRLGDQVSKPCAVFTRRVASSATDNLHDLSQAGTVANGQRMFAPNPVKTFLRHTKCNNDVYIVTVCLHFCSTKAFLNLALTSWVHQISYTQHSAIEAFD